MPQLTPFSQQSLERPQFIALLDTALGVKEFSYARLLALAWLTTFPGDLGAGLRHAQALAGLSLHRQAIPVLEAICQADPEFLPAQQLLAECASRVQHPATDEAKASVTALSAHPTAKETAPGAKWGSLLRQAKSFQAKNTDAKAVPEEKPAYGGEYGRLVHAAMLENPASPLAALAHLYYMREGWEQGVVVADAVTSLARAYHERWPRCLAFSLILADRLMDHGAGEEAVGLLHKVASRDVTAQVAIRIWGKEHPYRSLWPEKLLIEPANPGTSWAGSAASPQGLPIPAAVSAALGWNQLAPGKSPSTPLSATLSAKNGSMSNPSTRPTSRESDAQLSNKRKAVPASRPADFPVYVIFSNRQMLQQVYGLAAARRIEAAGRRLVKAIASRPEWDAMLFFPPARTAPYTPWDLKLALADLDDTLAGRGERIGALLILGGPEIVPFHQLPNPVDDSDEAVPSDNPYATRDENYFVAEWPVGRIPGGAGNDPSLLLQSLERFAAYHANQPASAGKQQPWISQWLANFAQLIRPPALRWPDFIRSDGLSSYGYTAAVWQRASFSVFRPIGQGSRIKVSPPLAIDALSPKDQPQLRLPSAKLAYFNLHGQRDTAVWYGQSDPTTASGTPKSDSIAKSQPKAVARLPKIEASQSDPGVTGRQANPDFPVALRPVDIYPGVPDHPLKWWTAWFSGTNPRRARRDAPDIIFSEACYGSHIDGRSTDQAISLTFLRAGSSSFIGSTCIAYGAISMPLTAADLLGHAFWQFLMDGHPTGEALRRAKVFLSTEMDRRQGYLDGEDQKTLISFVLYGDPLYNDSGAREIGAAARSHKHIPNLHPDGQNIQDWLTRGIEPEQGPVHTVCDRVETIDSGTPRANQPTTAGSEEAIPPEVLTHVRHIVAKYLPGMTDASMKLTAERTSCQAQGHTCPTAHLGVKALPPDAKKPDRSVVTLSKTFTCPVEDGMEGISGGSAITHQQFARLTLDASSNLVKLVVSR